MARRWRRWAAVRAWTPAVWVSSPSRSVATESAAAFLAALATGCPERFQGLSSWATATFEVSSGSPIGVGLDGETLEMDPPLTFSVRARR